MYWYFSADSIFTTLINDYDYDYAPFQFHFLQIEPEM